MSQYNPSQKYQDARKYVETWFSLRMYYVTADKQIRNLDQEKDFEAKFVSTEYIFNKMYFEYQNEYRQECVALTQYNKENGSSLRINKFSDKDLERAFNLHLQTARVKKRIEVVETIKFNPLDEKLIRYGRDQLSRFVAATVKYDSKDIEFKLSKVVLKHWLWCIKNKVIHDPNRVKYHIMPIFFGKKQGTGKSTALQKLITPLKEFTLSAKRLTDVSNPKEAGAFQENYVVIIEELAGSQKADIEQLKTVITESRVSFRKMRSNYNETVPQNCMFIGTSNKPLEDMIKDNTGMRRFFEYRVKDIVDWDVVNDINYEALWKAIDEHRPEGYLPSIMDELTQYQLTSTIEDPVEYIFSENNIELTEVYLKATSALDNLRSKKALLDEVNSGLYPIVLVDGKTLISKIMDELKGAGFTKFTKPSIGRKLKEAGLVRRRFNSATYYLLPKDQILLSEAYVEGSKYDTKLGIN